MRVKLLRLGHSAREFSDLPAGSTIKDLLDRADVPPSMRKSFSVTVDGLVVGHETNLVDGQICVVTPHIEGGVRA